MSFKVKVDALRRHAAELDTQSEVWGQAIPRKVVYGDVQLAGDTLTMAGGDLEAAYHGVVVQYGNYISAVNGALHQAATLLRRAADTYGDTDAIIADRF